MKTKRKPGRPAGTARRWVFRQIRLEPEDDLLLIKLSFVTGEGVSNIIRRAVRALLRREAKAC